MATRLAMLGCNKPYEGPWAIAKGNESGLEITGLASGEAVELQLCSKSGIHSYTFAKPGCFAIPKTGYDKYRVSKKHLSEVEKPSSTIVRVLLDGVT